MKNIIGPQEKLKRESRTIRPFRHAIIRLLKPAGGSLYYEYERNEFGLDLIEILSDGTGLYSLTFNPAVFKDATKVFGESQIAHTALDTPVLTSYFTDVTRSVYNLAVFDAVSFSYVDIEGEIIITIREYYA
jgi:hypothetical protein